MADAQKFEYPEWPDTPVPTAGPLETAPIASIRHSNTMGKLAGALAKAQLEFKAVLKQNDNPAFRSKYADLATVIEATQQALALQEVVVIQSPTTRGKDLTLTTLLLHSSGEWIASDLTMPATMRERFDAQSVGSAISYARRYSLQAVLGVAGEDDDGNEASGQGSQKAADAVAKQKIADFEARKGKKPDDDKYADVKASLSDCKNADDLNFLLEGWRGDKALVSDPNVRAFVHSRAKALNLVFDDSSRLWAVGAK
jgi:hypothetical protein